MVSGKGSEQVTDSTDSGVNGLGYPMVVLITVTVAVLLINFVETMVIPGIPNIQKDFSTTDSVASWITSAFLIVGAAVSPLFGKLGDVYGKKRMFLTVLVLYIIGVGMAGFSDSIFILLIARAIQGVGFAVFPLGIALVTDVFPRGKVASAQGIISGTIAIGMTLGLVIGAYVVQDLGWHYAFYITFVLSVGLFLVVAKVLRKDTPGPKTNMDYTGTVMLMAGITLVLIYLTEGPTIGWLSIENLAFLIPGLTLSILFFIFESKISSPLIQLSLLRIRNVLVANLLGVISGIVMFLAFFAIIYYAQLPAPFGLGMDIISTGLALAPATLIMMMVGPIVGRMLPKIGPKPIILIGSPVMIVGFLLFLLNRSTGLDLTIDAMVLFAGTIAVIIPMVNMISVSLPKDCMTTGMGFNTMLRNLGGAIGPVLATTLMTTFTAALIVNVGGKALNLGQFPSSSAFDLIFIFGIILSASIFGLGLMIKNYTFGKDST